VAEAQDFRKCAIAEDFRKCAIFSKFRSPNFCDCRKRVVIFVRINLIGKKSQPAYSNRVKSGDQHFQKKAHFEKSCASVSVPRPVRCAVALRLYYCPPPAAVQPCGCLGVCGRLGVCVRAPAGGCSVL
jgi:hypothetical protein